MSTNEKKGGASEGDVLVRILNDAHSSLESAAVTPVTL